MSPAVKIAILIVATVAGSALLGAGSTVISSGPHEAKQDGAIAAVRGEMVQNRQDAKDRYDEISRQIQSLNNKIDNLSTFLMKRGQRGQ